MYILISRKLDSTKPRHLARRWHSVCLFFPLVHLVFRVFILYAFSRLVMHPAGSSYAQFECWWMKNFVERISSKDTVSEYKVPWSRFSPVIFVRFGGKRRIYFWNFCQFQDSGPRSKFNRGYSPGFRLHRVSYIKNWLIRETLSQIEWRKTTWTTKPKCHVRKYVCKSIVSVLDFTRKSERGSIHYLVRVCK